MRSLLLLFLAFAWVQVAGWILDPHAKTLRSETRGSRTHLTAFVSAGPVGWVLNPRVQPFASAGASVARVPPEIAAFFEPPGEFASDFGDYRPALKFYDGAAVTTRADWQKRRREILAFWHGVMGSWPALIEKPGVEYLGREPRENFVQHVVRVEAAPQEQAVDGYLLVPEGAGPFPGVLVVYYDAETGIGKGRELRDFAYQLAKRGFVTLSIGTPEFCNLQAPYAPKGFGAENGKPLQPLSALAYVAANCHNALANLPNVDAERIGIVGHSYGGKWAMFASCLYEKFACAAWSDPGIVFDETHPGVNYWDPWYLGYERGRQRDKGIPNHANPRTGAYKALFESSHDLHELHVLMAPRSFLVSGGEIDRPQRWQALNHAIAVNKLLGCENRVAMTNRTAHAPTPESNEQIYTFFEHILKERR